MNSLRPTEIAERLLGPVEWLGPTRGQCVCPAQAQHTTPTHRRDCVVMLGGAPTVYCFHTSCLTALAQVNLELRRAITKGRLDRVAWKPSASDVQRQRERERLIRLGQRTKAQAPAILAAFASRAEELFGCSPVNVAGDVTDHWRLHLTTLFRPEDVLWIGATMDSCPDDAEDRRKQYCRAHFRTVRDWLKLARVPGQFTCPSLFKPGVHSRSNANVAERRFLVVEIDVLAKTEMQALLAWLAQFTMLRAVVDTAGKSLHGWVEKPPEVTLRELHFMLPALGCDPALFKPAQPCRLPGAWRDGKRQRLLWLAGSSAT